MLPKSSFDYVHLYTEATEEIAKVAAHINDNIRQHENFQKMLQIQKSFTGEGAPKILAPGNLPFLIKNRILQCGSGRVWKIIYKRIV